MDVWLVIVVGVDYVLCIVVGFCECGGGGDVL